MTSIERTAYPRFGRLVTACELDGLAPLAEVLERLGEPEAIIAAETPPPDEPPTRRGTKEWAAIILLLVGGFVFGFGWVVGLVLLWSSRAWTTRDKWIGTLVIPGGLAIGVLLGLIATGVPAKRLCYGIAGGVQHCTNAPGQSTPILGVAVFALLVLAPIATSVYLARRAAKP